MGVPMTCHELYSGHVGGFRGTLQRGLCLPVRYRAQQHPDFDAYQVAWVLLDGIGHPVRVGMANILELAPQSLVPEQPGGPNM